MTIIKPPYNGLSTEQVNDKIKLGQVNVQSHKDSTSILKIVIENSLTAFNLINMSILSFLVFYYFRTGDNRLLYDSIGIVSVTVINSFAGIYQKIKAARTLDKINLMKSYEITVVRDGVLKSILIDSIVSEDLIYLQKGDQVPVDGKIITSSNMQIDESLLTGESLPQDKTSDDQVLSGSFCIYGSGFYIAEKVGDESYANQITNLAKKYKLLSSPLMKKINWIFGVSFVITLIMVGIELLLSYIGGDLSVTEIRKISTIAFSLIPEGLVFFATVTFTIGIIRISKMGAIVQKINAIDAFSTIKVVCMDKTGTITKNQIKIAHINKFTEYSGRLGLDLNKVLGTYSALSNEKNATVKALGEFERYEDSEQIDELPFRSDLKLSILKIKINGSIETFILGGLDVLSAIISDSDVKTAQKLTLDNKLNGFRNLLFCRLILENEDRLIQELVRIRPIEPLCIISMKDEAREDAKEALDLFQQNHIDLKILTGDSSDSVLATLEEIGWNVKDEEVITGSEIDNLDQKQFEEIILHKKVFARLKPEHKLRIVRSLKHRKIQTAFVGDGVNDLPAIKEADLGITMEEGSTISKQVSDIVLLNNKFSILPHIFNEGNRIINTIKFVSRLYLSKNFVIFILSLLSWFFAFTYPLTPRKSALINVLGVGLPCYLIALLNTNSHRYPSFFRDLFSFMIVTSSMVLGIAFGVYYTSDHIFAMSHTDASNQMFIAMCIMSVFSFWATINYDDYQNRFRYSLYSFLILLVFFLFASVNMTIPPFSWLKQFYELGTLSLNHWLMLGVFIVPSIFVFVIIQHFRFKIMDKFFYKNMFSRKF